MHIKKKNMYSNQQWLYFIPVFDQKIFFLRPKIAFFLQSRSNNKKHPKAGRNYPPLIGTLIPKLVGDFQNKKNY